MHWHGAGIIWAVCFTRHTHFQGTFAPSLISCTRKRRTVREILYAIEPCKDDRYLMASSPAAMAIIAQLLSKALPGAHAAQERLNAVHHV